MERIAFYGMRRSGNHAILNWLLCNLSQKKNIIKIKHRLVSSGNSCYLNAINEYVNTKPKILEIDFKFAEVSFKNIVVSYEDVPINYQTKYTTNFPKIIVMRDINNLVASRLKKIKEDNEGKKMAKYLFNVNEKFFKSWITHASISRNEAYIIKFEEWISSKKIRDKISSDLGLKNIDYYQSISNYGGGSSFSGTSKRPEVSELNNRWKEVEIDSDLKKIINSEEILKLRKLHGYI